MWAAYNGTFSGLDNFGQNYWAVPDGRFGSLIWRLPPFFVLENLAILENLHWIYALKKSLLADQRLVIFLQQTGFATLFGG